MTEEDEAFNDIERQAKQRKEAVKSAVNMKDKLTKLIADSYDQGVKDALESVIQAIKELRPAIIEVKDCRDCPFAKGHRGHGECWTYCSHPKNNRPAYGNILWGCGAQYEATPVWCPLKAREA